MKLNKIYNIDVLEGLRQLEANSVDIVITSPPYNKAGLNGVQKDTHHKAKNGHKTIDYGGDATVDCKSEDDYQKWQLDILKECYRVLKNDGSLFYNHKNRIVKGTGRISSPYQWLSKSDFLVRQEIVWNRGNGKDCNPYRYYSTTERVYWLTKSSKTKLKITKDSLFSKEIWDIHADARTPHPAPFPLELPYAILSNIADTKGLTLLDPFMGSGTTAAMATMFDCNYIGFELFPEYIDIANQRVAIAKELKALGVTAKDLVKSQESTLDDAESCEDITFDESNHLEVNKFYNESCLDTMSKMGKQIDLVLTSPPYNITRKSTFRYDVYNDSMSEETYLHKTINLFKHFNNVVKKNGVVLYNFSYSARNPNLPYLLIADVVKNTEWTVVDTIVWKKKCAMPFPANQRRLSRNWEYIFVLTRKSDVDTFYCHKSPKSISNKTGQTYYDVIYNFIEAANNDGATSKLNQATFSTEMCMKLLSIYGYEGATVYDPFAGTGTTAVACKKMKMNFVGSEISSKQYEYAEERVSNVSESVIDISQTSNLNVA